MPVRVFHCDDSHAFRVLVAELLHDEPDIDLVGTAADGEGAVDGVALTQPDVVLLDLRGGDLSPGIVGRVRSAAPGSRIIVLSGWSGPIDERDIAARLGKDFAFDELAETIRAVAGSA